MANDRPATKNSNIIPNSDFLIRGSDYLANHSDFKLVGRDNDLKEVSIALMRKDNNNIILYGPNGVGTSAVVMGLQASKDLPNTPFDIVGKRFFWLDTDALFSSGDPNKINEGFQKAIATLSRSPETILVMDDVKDFLDGCRNSGTMNLINALMREVRNNHFQIIMEARDENLGDLFKAHSDISQIFTLKEIEPPADKAMLRLMLNESVKVLEKHHGVSISEAAINQVVDLTWKYPGLTLNMAQPKRSLMILEGAMTAFRYKAHTRPLELDGLEENLAILTELVIKGESSVPKAAEYIGKAPQEIEAMKLQTENQIREVTEAWEERQKLIREGYTSIRSGETRVREIEEEIAVLKEREDTARQLIKDYRAAEGDAGQQQAIKDTYFNKYGDQLIIPNNLEASTRVADKMRKNGAYSTAVDELETTKSTYEGMIAEDKKKFVQLTRGSEQLILSSDLVLNEFSKISRIPMNKLQQDETAKLRNLETTLKKRVFGQDEPIIAVSKAIRRARTGLKKPGEPIGSFMFLGPTGVGKTELGLALGEALFGDESAVQVYNMGEYMEKHAVSTLIGAPPGYDCWEAGGVLTNNMRRKPYVVNIFDEVEKAHKDVYDIFLSIIDKGRVDDRRGVPTSFANAVNIFTSNIGAHHFLKDDLVPPERLEEIKAEAEKQANGNEELAKKIYRQIRREEIFKAAQILALADLKNKDVSGLRPEFLARFNGIFWFNALGQPEVLMLTDKFLKELNGWIEEKGLSVVMPEKDRIVMCEEKYDPHQGGRSIRNYIRNYVASDVSDTLLDCPNQPGVVHVSYDKEKRDVVSKFVPKEEINQQPVIAANENKDVATPASAADAAKSAFKPK